MCGVLGGWCFVRDSNNSKTIDTDWGCNDRNVWPYGLDVTGDFEAKSLELMENTRGAR